MEGFDSLLSEDEVAAISGFKWNLLHQWIGDME
jgi:hypothetical protein